MPPRHQWRSPPPAATRSGVAGEGLSCCRAQRAGREGESPVEKARRGAQGRGGGGAAGRWAVARKAGWSRSRSEAGGRERTEVARAGQGADSALRVPRVSERARARAVEAWDTEGAVPWDPLEAGRRGLRVGGESAGRILGRTELTEGLKHLEPPAGGGSRWHTGASLTRLYQALPCKSPFDRWEN